MNEKKKKRGGEINSDGSKGNGGLSDTSKHYGIIGKGIIMKSQCTYETNSAQRSD
jgi:hypothetical protein